MATDEEEEPPRNFRLPEGGDVITHGAREYQVHEMLGEGAFGRVFACTDDWGNELAAKVLVPRGRTFREIEDNWRRELKALVELRHPNITFVHDAFLCEDAFYIIVERCVWPVSSLLQDDDGETALWLPYIARDLLQAVSFVHGEGYVHKDIHGGNVFVFHAKDAMVPDKKPVWSFKLGDFGISNLAAEINSGTVLAEWMRPPEAIQPDEFGAIGPATDIYHAGLLLLSFAAGKQLEFTKEEILDGAPRRTAEESGSPYSAALARALRRHVSARTPTALELWREIKSVARGAGGA
jgi:serine/threonine-protein kinase